MDPNVTPQPSAGLLKASSETHTEPLLGEEEAVEAVRLGVDSPAAGSWPATLPPASCRSPLPLTHPPLSPSPGGAEVSLSPHSLGAVPDGGPFPVQAAPFLQKGSQRGMSPVTITQDERDRVPSNLRK